MSNNRMSKKAEAPVQVNDTKATEVQPERQKIEINQGNTAVLTIQILNMIYENVLAIRKVLEK